MGLLEEKLLFVALDCIGDVGSETELASVLAFGGTLRCQDDVLVGDSSMLDLVRASMKAVMLYRALCEFVHALFQTVLGSSCLGLVGAALGPCGIPG